MYIANHDSVDASGKSRLEDKITEIGGNQTIRVSGRCRTPDERRAVQAQGEQAVSSASLIKHFILYRLFEENRGKGDLAMFRLEYMAAFMLAVSDNTATNLLIDELVKEAIAF